LFVSFFFTDLFLFLGIAAHKLVTVVRVDGVKPYATFGFSVGVIALAGMSSTGITVSEMNLDNSRTSFDGPPFPLRLRMVLERASTLEEARAIWDATNNTDSMNYLLASGREKSAIAIETVADFSAYYTANDPIEAAATCLENASQPGHTGGTCGTGFPDLPYKDGVKSIGMPMAEALWRSNHAVHPKLMPTQEPLFNDTTFRYTKLAEMFNGYEKNNQLIGEEEAVAIGATVAIKGPNFLSCDKEQFKNEHATNILSAVYVPAGQDTASSNSRAWVAWEDGSGLEAWRPAACNTFIGFDLDHFFG